MDCARLFGATLLGKVYASIAARVHGWLALNGATESRDSLGDIPATHRA